MSASLSKCCDAPRLEGGLCSHCREHAEFHEVPDDTVHVIECAGWFNRLDRCPAGLFFFQGTLCFKTEYRDKNGPEAYVVASGEYFWGGTDTAEKRAALQVIPWRLRKGDE